MRKIWNSHEIALLRQLQRQLGSGEIDFVTYHECLSVLWDVN